MPELTQRKEESYINRLENPSYDIKKRMYDQYMVQAEVWEGKRYWRSHDSISYFPESWVNVYEKDHRSTDLESFLDPFIVHPSLPFLVAQAEGKVQWGDGFHFKVFEREQQEEKQTQVLEILQSKVVPKILARIDNYGAYEENDIRYIEPGLNIIGALCQRALYTAGKTETPVFGPYQVSFPPDIFQRMPMYLNLNHKGITYDTLWQFIRHGDELSILEHEENRDFDYAAVHFNAYLESGKPLNETVLYSLHDMLLEHQVSEEFRGVPRLISHVTNLVEGVHASTPSGQVESLLQEDINSYNELMQSYSANSSDEALRAFLEWHLHFEITHPFMDGNGRIGRLLLNGLQQNAGMSLFVSTPEIHETYGIFMKTLNFHQTQGHIKEYEQTLSDFMAFVKEASHANTIVEVAQLYTPSTIELMK